MTLMQRAVALIYPERCAVCSNLTDANGGLCATCWRDARFATGLMCDMCATPLLGGGDEGLELCDECHASPKPWSRGRAAMYYTGVGRRIVLSLKYGDRTELAKPAAAWMSRAGADILTEDPVLIPIPSHWLRLLKRRYNPTVELAHALGRSTGLTVLPDGLIRHRSGKTQEGLDYTARFKNLEGAFRVNPRLESEISGKSVCIVDDTLVSGATLSEATSAALEAGARSVSVLVLARALKYS